MAPGRRSEIVVKGELSLHKSRYLLTKHRELDRILRTLGQKVNQDSNDSLKYKALLAKARACIPQETRFISKRHLSLLTPEFCPPHATGLAQKVFDIPELLEHILRQLEIPTLLKPQMINRQFRDAVETSTRLQRKMSLIPHASKGLYAPFAHGGFLKFWCNLLAGIITSDGSILPLRSFAPGEIDEDDRDPASSSHFVLEAWFHGPFPSKGSRCRRMLLTQPPITNIEVLTDCCYDPEEYEDYPNSRRILRNDSGISIGDLLRATEEMSKSHRHCPHASGSLLSENCDVKVPTRFQAEITLGLDDPVVKEKLRKEVTSKQMDGQKRSQRKMMEAFAEERLEAHEAGEDVPDFASWRLT